MRILHGDCRDVLPTLAAESVNACVTSPPYFGLRSYLAAEHPDKAREIGSEDTPDEYIAALIGVFREVKRVLRSDGVLWVNIGDSYATGPSGSLSVGRSGLEGGQSGQVAYRAASKAKKVPAGLKPKDLIGIPWMLAFALRADGWWLRADHVWGKPNGMPESTTDRTTRAHEYVFLLSKSPTYWYDHEAVRTAPKASTITQLAKPYTGQSTKDHVSNGVQDASDLKRRIVDKMRKPPSPKHLGEPTGHPADIKARHDDKQRGHSRRHDGFNDRWDAMERDEQVAQGGNLRSIWWIPPAQYRDGHFAVMPDMVAEICIRAGCPIGGTVLDPFSGAGTTALVADRLGRDCIGIELNRTFVEMSAARVQKDAGMFAAISAVLRPSLDDAGL